MLDFDHLAPDTLSATVTGVMTPDDAVQIAGAAAALGETVHLLLDLAGLTDIDPGEDAAALEDPALRLVYRIGRVGVVSDFSWVGVLPRLAARVSPDVVGRTFRPEARQEAQDFVLNQGDEGALRLVASFHPDLIVCEVDGVVQQGGADRLVRLMETALGRGRPVSLILKIRTYGGFEPQMMLSGPLWGMKLTGIANLHRYAVVGADPWMQGLANIANPFGVGKMRLFAQGEDAAARAWATDGLQRV